jgi:hypothetical protein
MRIRGLLLVAVVAGLALLTACEGGGGDETPTTPIPTPSVSTADGGELTAEQAIQRVLEILEEAPDQHPDPSTATAERIRGCETDDVMRWEGRQWGGPPDNPSEKPAWVVKVRGEFTNPTATGSGTDTPRPGTFISTVGSGGGGGMVRFDERDYEGPELSSEGVIGRVMLEIGGWPLEDQSGMHSATATRMTEREALEALEREGGAPDLSMRVLTDDPAWLVEVGGESVDSCTLAPLQGRYLSVRHLDGSPVSSGFIPDDTATPVPGVELTREQAIERAFERLANYLFYQPDVSTAAATRMLYGEALETVRREGGSADGASGVPSDLPVWLVEVKGMNVKVGVPATYVFILNLHGGSEYDEQIFDSTPTP